MGVNGDGLRLPPPPAALFPGLYRAVAEAGIFQNIKSFADASPLAAPNVIISAFASLDEKSPATLRQFIDRWFALPEAPACDVEAGDATMKEHIDALWPKFARRNAETNPYSSLLPTRNRYLVPGGIFREWYYWDSYFAQIGLGEAHKNLSADLVDNFADAINRYGFVPNGNRSYYLSRSQPPVFYACLAALDPSDPEAAWTRYLPQLLAEHAYWMSGESALRPGDAIQRVVAMPDGAVLNRYWDGEDGPRDESCDRDLAISASAPHRNPQELFRDIRAACESGWDFSSRWFAGRPHLSEIITTSIAPIDLNCLLHGLECAIEAGARRAGDMQTAREFERRASNRKAALNEFLWNDRLGVFDDFDVRIGERRGMITAACVFPLFGGLATENQAASTAYTVSSSLLAPGGLLTTLQISGEQWDAPNGWAPMQWIAVNGLRRYGRLDLAREIARRWLAMVASIYSKTGRLVEKYNVMANEPGGGGEYPLQDGFGWTNGVTAALLRLYPEFAGYGATRPARAM